MNKEKYNQMIDEAYSNYRKTILNEFFENTKELRKWAAVEGPGGYNREEFINKCKTDKEFSEKWGLKIEERELSLEERRKISPNSKTTDMFKDLCIDFSSVVKMGCWNDQMSLEDFNNDIKQDIHKWYDSENIPTKLITITYKNERIESYE